MAKSAKTTTTTTTRKGKRVDIKLAAAILATLQTLKDYFSDQSNADKHLPLIGTDADGHRVYDNAHVVVKDGSKYNVSRLKKAIDKTNLPAGYVLVRSFANVKAKMTASADPLIQAEFIRVWNSSETREEVNAHYNAKYGEQWVSAMANRMRKAYKDAGRDDCPLKHFLGRLGIGRTSIAASMDLDALAGVKKTVDKPAKKPARRKK